MQIQPLSFKDMNHEGIIDLLFVFFFFIHLPICRTSSRYLQGSPSKHIHTMNVEVLGMPEYRIFVSRGLGHLNDW